MDCHPYKNFCIFFFTSQRCCQTTCFKKAFIKYPLKDEVDDVQETIENIRTFINKDRSIDRETNDQEIDVDNGDDNEIVGQEEQVIENEEVEEQADRQVIHTLNDKKGLAIYKTYLIVYLSGMAIQIRNLEFGMRLFFINNHKSNYGIFSVDSVDCCKEPEIANSIADS